VNSAESCFAICEAEKPLCRGSVAYQSDVRQPIFQCRLNNGTGTNPAFPQSEPELLDFDRALVEVNAYRAQHGAGALIYNAKLSQASETHSADLAQAGLISHTGTDGSDHGTRIRAQNYTYSVAGENVATGQKTWDKVFVDWQNSPEHNAILLNPDVTEFGLALVYEPTTRYSTYWTMLVARPDVTVDMAKAR